MKLKALPDFAAALAALRSAGLSTITEVLVVLEILRGEQIGDRHTLSTLAEALDMPISTVARVVLTLVDKYQLVTQASSKTDRRIKFLAIDWPALQRIVGAAS